MNSSRGWTFATTGVLVRYQRLCSVNMNCRLLRTSPCLRPLVDMTPDSRPSGMVLSFFPLPQLKTFPPRLVHAPDESLAHVMSLAVPGLLSPMGSFNSSPKIMNEDTEDDDVELPQRMSHDQVLSHCRQQVNSPPLIGRQFRHLQPALSDYCDLSKKTPLTTRVFQWNLLSQALGQNNDNFVCCPDSALEWKRRRHLMAEEILKYSPDIICLQEVDHFKFLQKVLGTQGFKGTFFPKPDSPCMYIKENNGPDGCAIFYQTERYELIRTETRILEVWRVQSNQVAILVILKDKLTDEEICVATTHLKARNGALLSALRNEQGKDLLEFIAQHAGNRPVILSGDFNAEPSEPIYSTVLSHDLLQLGSAYCKESEPPYTTWKIREEGEICHTIDYIFCSRNRFTTTNLLEFPSGEEIGVDRIPSLSYPSDHFSLVCDLSLKST